MHHAAGVNASSTTTGNHTLDLVIAVALGIIALRGAGGYLLDAVSWAWKRIRGEAETWRSRRHARVEATVRQVLAEMAPERDDLRERYDALSAKVDEICQQFRANGGNSFYDQLEAIADSLRDRVARLEGMHTESDRARERMHEDLNRELRRANANISSYTEIAAQDFAEIWAALAPLGIDRRGDEGPDGG